jgi:hypothetical protein
MAQQIYCTGKLPKQVDPKGRTLMMAKYMVAVPDPPRRFSNLDVVANKLKFTGTIAQLFPMDGNDTVGDCVVAAKAHKITIDNGRVGELQVPTLKEVLDFYWGRTGGEDTGLNMLDTLKYLRKHPLHSHKILGFGEIDLHNHKLVKQCIWLFGGVDLGFLVQNAAFADFDANRVWTPGPSDGGGHDVLAAEYDDDADTISLLTWGGRAKGNWAWWDAQVDEAYAILPPEAKLKGFADGFNYKQLAADLKAVTK